MSFNLWEHCQGNQAIRRLSAKPWRAVEAQHKVITRKLVDSLEEQLLLEELLEANKPSLPANDNLHYLLTTPFRYPPLKHGSRYGSRLRRGIWYGSAKVNTALSEVAYYRFLFLAHTEAELETIYTDFTLFKASVKTSWGVDLTREPFLEYTKQLTHSTDYKVTQALGDEMRENNVQAVRFFSARDRHNGINIAVFNRLAFNQKSPLEFQHWHCAANRQRVEFLKQDLIKQSIVKFNKDYF